MTLENQMIVALELALAAFLSMIIGLDRERRVRAAGLRTHMLIGMTACLFASLAKYAFPAGDPSHVASTIVTGIGFLGAGMIVRHRKRVHLLTTAAGVWAVAAIGVAVGMEMWFVAIVATILGWTIIALLYRFEDA